VGVQASKSYK
jgi:hypothetical protein